MSTENWIALFVVLLVPLAAIIMTLWHQWQDEKRHHRALHQAYQALNKEMQQRTQHLRSLNNSLYGEIRQHEATEAKLHQSENYLYSIINSMPSILIGVTPEGVITHWNSSAEKDSRLKEKEVLGRYLWDAYPHLPVDIWMIREAIQDKQPKVRQNFKQVRQGETVYSDITIYPLLSADHNSLQEAIIQVDDVTVRVMMENMMIQNEKMLSLGELAAGLAHEINNPLGAILQSVQNIERRLSTDLPRNHEAANKAGASLDAMMVYLEDRQIPKFLADIRDAGERSSRIVSNMLTFSHRSQQHIAVDINDLAQHCLELADNQFHIKGSQGNLRIEVRTCFDPALPKIDGSPAEIQQVLLNLLRNARQCFSSASEMTRDPMITLTTQWVGNSVEIKVGDNGPGIAEEIRRHIFEPFFTTKEVGQGTGLGLSISYFIITEHHGGQITVDSTLGHGTTFTITLPTTQPVTETDIASHGNI